MPKTMTLSQVHDAIGAERMACLETRSDVFLLS